MRKFCSVIFILLLSVAAFAQHSNGPSVTMVPADVAAVPIGGSRPVTLTFRVAPGFHINSNKPNSELLVATALKLSPPTELMTGKVEYPAGEQLKFPFSDEMLSVYSGDFQVKALVRAPRNASAGTYRVRGELKFQACNDRQCFPPKTMPVEFDVKLVKAARTRK